MKLSTYVKTLAMLIMVFIFSLITKRCTYVIYGYFIFKKSVNWIKRMYMYRNTEEPVYCESQSSVESVKWKIVIKR